MATTSSLLSPGQLPATPEFLSNGIDIDNDTKDSTPNDISTNNTCEADNPMYHLLRLGIASTIASVGFQNVELQNFGYENEDEEVELSNPLDSLSGLAIDLVVELGKLARTMAHLACRNRPNSYDMLSALHQTGIELPVLTKAAEGHRQAAILRQIMKRHTTTSKTSQDIAIEPPMKIVPEHLQVPPLPEPHTYKRTAIYDKEQTDFILWRRKRASDKKRVLYNLSKLATKTAYPKPKRVKTDTQMAADFPLLLTRPQRGVSYLAPLCTHCDPPAPAVVPAATANPYLPPSPEQAEPVDQDDDKM